MQILDSPVSRSPSRARARYGMLMLGESLPSPAGIFTDMLRRIAWHLGTRASHFSSFAYDEDFLATDKHR